MRDFQSSPVRRTDAKSSKTLGFTSSGCLERENREEDFCWKPKESVLNLVLDLCLIPVLLLLILDLGFRLWRLFMGDLSSESEGYGYPPPLDLLSSSNSSLSSFDLGTLPSTPLLPCPVCVKPSSFSSSWSSCMVAWCPWKAYPSLLRGKACIQRR